MTVNGNAVNISAVGAGNRLKFYWAINGTPSGTPRRSRARAACGNQRRPRPGPKSDPGGACLRHPRLADPDCRTRAGLADAGIASEPAALAYDLVFIPLAKRFDLVVPAGQVSSREVQGLLKVLSSAWPLDQLASLPGYNQGRRNPQAGGLICGAQLPVAGNVRDSRCCDEFAGCFGSGCQQAVIAMPGGDRQVGRDRARPGPEFRRAGRN
jgi:hypothetical protein